MKKSNDVEKEVTNTLPIDQKTYLEMEARRQALDIVRDYRRNGVEYFIAEFSRIARELASERESPDAKE
ncbi:hypothetical protein EZS27_006053 [termite gut metagenome]|uniref:Uncharacterized protein n=1 Tax=termite gut metagenome TaxID=433724 RepID=A0A5J4SM32_9ZZZZ